jgi:hypothetical protein
MHKALLAAAIVVLPLFSVPPAFAMKGIEAARSCESQPKRCKVIYEESGDIHILVDGRVIHCSGPQEECTVVRQGGKPGGAADPLTPAAPGPGNLTLLR